MKRKRRGAAYPAADRERKRLIEVDGDMLIDAFERHSGGDTSMRVFILTVAATDNPTRRDEAWTTFLRSLLRIGDSLAHCDVLRRQLQGACLECQRAFIAQLAATAIQSIFRRPQEEATIALLVESVRKADAAWMHMERGQR